MAGNVVNIKICSPPKLHSVLIEGATQSVTTHTCAVVLNLKEHTFEI